eukprot:gnl/MRDRNA2_/MRDRNA2_107053_c0_seq1.p1 gnl/MRDRNA2_/MRDRNA2_107053_c0~~gnl/MRDRNA2_/MRDRNA2_107053_c0_seq1.p1  ORF type:complete len:248 (+),score=66.57 gnl/MRDRNA2_/MRDRNA2_107053_c0_seq1:123-866(+)
MNTIFGVALCFMKMTVASDLVTHCNATEVGSSLHSHVLDKVTLAKTCPHKKYYSSSHYRPAFPVPHPPFSQTVAYSLFHRRLPVARANADPTQEQPAVPVQHRRRRSELARQLVDVEQSVAELLEVAADSKIKAVAARIKYEVAFAASTARAEEAAAAAAAGNFEAIAAGAAAATAEAEKAKDAEQEASIMEKAALVQVAAAFKARDLAAEARNVTEAAATAAARVEAAKEAAAEASGDTSAANTTT